jgi:hypothetical protein
MTTTNSVNLEFLISGAIELSNENWIGMPTLKTLKLL